MTSKPSKPPICPLCGWEIAVEINSDAQILLKCPDHGGVECKWVYVVSEVG